MAQEVMEDIIDEEDQIEDNEDLLETWNILYIDIFKKITLTDFGVLVKSNTEEIAGMNIFFCLDVLCQVHKNNSPNSAQKNFLTKLLKFLKYEEVRQFLYKYKFLVLARRLLKDSLPYCTTVVVEIIASLCQCEVGKIPDYVVEMIEWIGKDKNMANDLARYLNYFMEDTVAHGRLVENTLKFFYSVMVVLTINPTSVWIKRLKICNFYNYILYIIRNKCDDSKSSFSQLALACDTLVILSEINLPDASKSYKTLLSDNFDMENLIDTLCDMQYFNKINDNSIPHWKFYKNWLTLVENIKNNDLFDFNLQTVRNIFTYMKIMLDNFLKTFRTLIRKFIKRPDTFENLLKHIDMVYKCMRLAEEFKKNVDIQMTILQVTCGIEHRFLTIHLLLNKLYDIFDCRIKMSRVPGALYSRDLFNKNILDVIDQARINLSIYLDSAIEHQSKHHSSFFLFLQLCMIIQQEYDKEVSPLQYLRCVQNRILYITRDVNNAEHKLLRQTFHKFRREIMENFFYDEHKHDSGDMKKRFEQE